MSDQNSGKLEAKIEQLERRVERLEHELEVERTSKSVNTGDDVVAQKPEAAAKVGKEDDASSKGFQFGEEWINRIGIGLLLIGVAFLFKYSIDQGWLVPPVRSAIGFIIGLVLFGGGLRMQDEMKPLKQIVLGGGIGVFYITGFATFQLYSFMPSVVVWSFMIVVTLLALSLSVQQSEAVLSVVGTLGALGTPFMLYTGGGSIIHLVLYITLVLVGAAAIYMRKGWKSLLWCIAAGGVAVFTVADFNYSYGAIHPASVEKSVMQVGVVIWIAGSWILPVYRELLTLQDPNRWPTPKMLLGDGSVDEMVPPRTSSSVHLAAFLAPLFGMLLTTEIWSFSDLQSGFSYIAVAVFTFASYRPLKDKQLSSLAATHLLLGTLLLTIGCFIMLEANLLMIIMLAEAVMLRFISRQTEDRKFALSSHLVFFIVVVWFLNSLPIYQIDPGPFVSVETLSQVLILGVGGLLLPQWMDEKNLKGLYRIGSHLMFLIWIYQKVVVFENGQAWVSILWGIYAVILLALGFAKYGRGMRLAGMGTVFLVVGKLFLVDLSKLQAIWRILLFMGFGTVLLLLGYYLQSQWSEEKRES